MFDAHPASRVRCAGIDAISLLFHKEMAKEREPRGLMPLGTPWRATKSQGFSDCGAKASSFNACERGLKKATLTLGQAFLLVEKMGQGLAPAVVLAKFCSLDALFKGKAFCGASGRGPTS